MCSTVSFPPLPQLEKIGLASELPTFRSATNRSARQVLHSTSIFPMPAYAATEPAECAAGTNLRLTIASPHYQIPGDCELPEDISGRVLLSLLLDLLSGDFPFSLESREHGLLAWLLLLQRVKI